MEDNKEEIIEHIEEKVQENKEVPYSKKLETISKEDKEYREVRERASEIEGYVKSNAEIKHNISSYLSKSDHPRTGEYNSIIEDIQKAGYSVHDENNHYNFVATKLFLTKDDVPNSLKSHYEAIENSNQMTPAVKDSIEKLKYFTENAMERANREVTRSKLVDKYGNTKNIDPTDFQSVISDFDHGRISAEEFEKSKKEFLDSTELKRKAAGI